MNLKRLLATSRSFASLDEKNPYAMCKDNLLPAFNTQPRLRRAHTQDRPLIQPELSSAPAPRKEPLAMEKASGHTLAAGEQLKLTGQAQPPVAVRAKRPGFWAVFRSLFGFRRRGPRALVQSEMELDKVKVVRNDLSDADLELMVPAKNGRPARPLYKTQHGAERNPLIQIRTRLFESTQF